VLLIDGDVMPNTSLDYLFEMSDGENATLKENLITAGKMEPANAVSLFLPTALLVCIGWLELLKLSLSHQYPLILLI
jgi:hypothetical protein